MDSMVNAIIVVILVIVLLSALKGGIKRLRGGCCAGGGYRVRKVKAANTDRAHYTYRSVVYIDGMTCDKCAARVENAFNLTPGCMARVSLGKKYAEVWSERELTEEELRKIVGKDGYTFVKSTAEKVK